MCVFNGKKRKKSSFSKLRRLIKLIRLQFFALNYTFLDQNGLKHITQSIVYFRVEGTFYTTWDV